MQSLSLSSSSPSCLSGRTAGLVGFATVIEKGEGLMRTSLWNYFDIIGISNDEDDDEDEDDGDDGAAWLAGKLSLFSSCLAAT